MNFCSDNVTGAAPEILAALVAVNTGALASYGADDPFILLYTSGTTGHPGGVEVPVRALAAFRAYLHFGLDLRPEDVYWNAADPGSARTWAETEAAGHGISLRTRPLPVRAPQDLDAVLDTCAADQGAAALLVVPPPTLSRSRTTTSRAPRRAR